MGTVTIGATDYDIYGERTAAATYLDVHLNAIAWAAGTTEFQNKVLVMATRLMDRMAWKGELTDSDQPIDWPRTGTGVTGVEDAVIPTDILYGFYELSVLIAEDPTIINNATSGSNVQRAKAGEAEVWFFRSTADTATKLPTSVHELVKRFLAGDDGILSLDSGTYTEEFVSVFDETPDRSGGLY
jgi:hypothetical protein